MKVKIILEAGINHNGSLNLAKKMVDVAAKSGADFIKFQTFKTDFLVTKNAKRARYSVKNFKKKLTQYQMLKKFELSEKDHHILIKYCKKKNINFLSSPFSIESFNFLNKLKVDTIKIPSGEITNLPFLRHIGKHKKKIVISTGMSYLNEVNEALKILVKSGTAKKNITVLHCNTEYPSPFKDINLKAMLTIKKKLKVKIGYSDHSLGTIVPIAATALGASIIEKHFTLNKKLSGPDHKASLSPSEVYEMVNEIRATEKILGSNIKKPTSSEKKNKIPARKSIVAKNFIKKGDKFTEDNLTTKRPGNGISPMNWNRIIGKKSKKNYKKDDLI